MILDRQLQLELLQKMSTTYPEFYNFRDEYEHGTEEYKKVVANLYYLMQHGLIEERSLMESKVMSGIKRPQISLPTINQNGLDFLANDGGLSAILSTVTIKIDTEQFRQLLLARINESNLPPDQKNQIVSALESLPAESIKHLSTKVVDWGWDNFDQLMQLIQSSLP
jgi:hypothetical protein